MIADRRKNKSGPAAMTIALRDLSPDQLAMVTAMLRQLPTRQVAAVVGHLPKNMKW